MPRIFVTFDLEDFAEGETASPVKITENCKRLGTLFDQAFETSEPSQFTYNEEMTRVEFSVHVSGTIRTSAVQEILQWITTADAIIDAS
jgi:hypothetical protein